VQIISDGVDRLDHGSPAETIRVHVESGSCRRTSSSPHPRATPPAEPSHGLWRAGASDDTRRGTPGRPGRVSQSPFSSPQSLPSTPGSILAFYILDSRPEERVSPQAPAWTSRPAHHSASPRRGHLPRMSQLGPAVRRHRSPGKAAPTRKHLARVWPSR
jgi:hypothetical protein